LTILAQIADQAAAQSTAEIVAVLAALAYLVFAIRQHIVCWIFAAISTAIYVWLFIEARLYMESMLNVFYLVMAGYGWYVWRSGSSDGHERPVVIWPRNTHLKAILFLGRTGRIRSSCLPSSAVRRVWD
jgi:nicotinamide mononucleotide transporter